MDSSDHILDRSRNLYVCHRWHYDAAWIDFVAMIDETLGQEWRNWSLPWHDPSLDRNGAPGELKLQKMLQGQIANSEMIFLLQDIADIGGPRSPWFPRQIEIARQLGKTIVGVAGIKGNALAPDWHSMCTTSIPFTRAQVRTVLEEGI